MFTYETGLPSAKKKKKKKKKKKTFCILSIEFSQVIRVCYYQLASPPSISDYIWLFAREFAPFLGQFTAARGSSLASNLKPSFLSLITYP
jgi:hypothetical protein